MLKSLAQQLFRKPEAAQFLAKNEKSTMFLGEMKSGHETMVIRRRFEAASLGCRSKRLRKNNHVVEYACRRVECR